MIALAIGTAEYLRQFEGRSDIRCFLLEKPSEDNSASVPPGPELQKSDREDASPPLSASSTRTGLPPHLGTECQPLLANRHSALCTDIRLPEQHPASSEISSVENPLVESSNSTLARQGDGVIGPSPAGISADRGSPSHQGEAA